MAPELPPLRVALVLSGAVALGSFEAGVVYELLGAMARGAPLTIDLVAGSSAGALVGAAAVRSLLTGAPYGPPLRAWTDITLHRLTSGYERPGQARRRHKAPDVGLLSSEYVRRLVREMVVRGARGPAFAPRYPPDRLAFLVALTNLSGLPGTGAPGDEFRFSEAITFAFYPAAGPLPPGVWERVAQVILASSAIPPAFDPVRLDWRHRLRFPAVTEIWENDPLLAALEQRAPGRQAAMYYSDGAILDSQPLERAVSALVHVAGAGALHRLVFDPTRCVLVVEPDPPSVPLGESGAPMGLFTLLARALWLWTISASAGAGRRRVQWANDRIVQLLEFLALLGQQIRGGLRPASAVEVVDRYTALEAAAAGEGPGAAHHGPTSARQPSPAAGQGPAAPALPPPGDPGAVPPDLFAQAVAAFYAWLAGPAAEADLAYLDRLGAARLARQQAPVVRAIRRLRQAYLGLAGLDPADPGRYQRLLAEVHVQLAVRLGLNRPWVLVDYVAPENAEELLRGEEVLHFGGFFSRAFLRYDFEVGRYYAQRWLAGTCPAAVGPPAPPPQPSRAGLSWSLVLDNGRPLLQVARRLLAAAGWSAAGPLRRTAAYLVGGLLGASTAASVAWALLWPLRWLTGSPAVAAAQAALAGLAAAFPLALLGLLLSVIPRDLYRALVDHLRRRTRPGRRR